jgi:ribosomal protein S18 acetylase RimI-like enzyme
MLEPARGLSEAALDAIARLEERVVAVDGGRLKLEWGHLRNRAGEQVEDLLWWDGDQLLGFLGIYRFASPPELAGMVAPDTRRQGIGGALLDAALELCRACGDEEILLVVPRASVGGRALALARGGTLDHSEYALVISGEPVGRAGGPDGPGGVSLRVAGEADLPVLSRLLEAGFGRPAPDLSERFASPRQATFVIDHDGAPVGTVLATQEADGEAGVYGFVIDPDRQGQGLGRDALRQLCSRLRAEGAARIRLDVAVDNDRALTLYTSLGFEPVTTEDYYAIPLTAPPDGPADGRPGP